MEPKQDQNEQIEEKKSLNLQLSFSSALRSSALGPMALREQLPPLDRSASFQAVSVWLTEIPEIQADGSSPWLMMSQADPFVCPPRSSPNPPPFSYVLHDKSHHASLLTPPAPTLHPDPPPAQPGFGRTGAGFPRVNRKLRGVSDIRGRMLSSPGSSGVTADVLRPAESPNPSINPAGRGGVKNLLFKSETMIFF